MYLKVGIFCKLTFESSMDSWNLNYNKWCKVCCLLENIRVCSLYLQFNVKIKIYDLRIRVVVKVDENILELQLWLSKNSIQT